MILERQVNVCAFIKDFNIDIHPSNIYIFFICRKHIYILNKSWLLKYISVNSLKKQFNFVYESYIRTEYILSINIRNETQLFSTYVWIFFKL